MSWAKGGSSSPSSLCRRLPRALVNSPPRTMPTPGRRAAPAATAAPANPRGSALGRRDRPPAPRPGEAAPRCPRSPGSALCSPADTL
ncbi:hypothetical protein MC885_019882 [Smutsia gigantea]|nr:hypothetical protein MC885_019882 [Smutsia gigantea]